MSRLVLPLLDRKLWATGDVLLRAELELLVKAGGGNWKSQVFRADPGSEMTTMPAYEAKKLGLPMPAKAATGVVHQPTGLELRSGYIRAQVVGMDGTVYAFPCFFLGDPDTPPNPAAAAVPRNLLGLSGVVNLIRITFDGDPAPGAPYGTMTVEKK